ncbi:hypothetical protein IKG48_02210 [Candidatus Saccharibacteria bacterium]|nr:hypothetical protein [Candidatus Saccharibacteria bacterium]
MLKSTKIVAGFGVVAALSVAALPAASFADTETTYNGQVTLRATLQDEISIKIDTADMTTSGSAGEGTLVEFMNSESTPTSSLSTGKSYFTGNKTQITVETNVPNTYTLSASGTELTSGNNDTIARAGYDSASGGLTITNTNEDDYAGDSMWGIKISGTNKAGTAISLSTSTGTASAFQGATKYQISGTETVVDFAEVDGAKIQNTYDVDYGIGINENQPSGVYEGTANYSVTHIKA